MVHPIKVLMTSQKGGVGKSTVAANLAAYLAHVKRKRVCLLDFDHQASSSGWVNRQPVEGLTTIFCDALSERDPMVSVLKMKQAVRAAERDHEIVLVDLTWVRFFPQSYVMDFDFVLVPTSLSHLELNSTIEFVTHFSTIFNSTSEVTPKLVLIPTRLHTTRDYQDIFTQNNFPVRFNLSSPIPFDLDIQHLYGQQYIYELTDSPVSFGFAKVGDELDAVFDKQLAIKKRLAKAKNVSFIAESRQAITTQPSVLDRFCLEQRSLRSAREMSTQAASQEASAMAKFLNVFKKAS